MKLWTRYLVAGALAVVLFGSGVIGQEKKMADIDIPTEYSMWIKLRGIDMTDTDKVPLPDDVDNVKLLLIGYNTTTNRIRIVEYTGDVRELPTFDQNIFDHLGNDFVPIVNQVGDFDSVPNDSLTPNPMVDLSVSGPAGIRWPQGNGTTGQALIIGSIVPELARDGVSSVNRHRLQWSTVPTLQALVAGVDLNVTTKTTLFIPDTGQTWIVDYCIVRAASTSLTTVQFPFGSNANADDWLATDLYSELTTATKFTTVYPMDGAEVTTDMTPFGIKPTIAQGAAATVTIEVYAHRIS